MGVVKVDIRKQSNRIQQFFLFRFIFVLAISFLSGFPVSAKPVKKPSKRSSFTHPVWKKKAALGYPDFHKSLGLSSEESNTRPDSELSRHWGLSSIGFFKAFTPLVQPIVQPNLQNVKTCSKDVVVAVVDTGLDYTHPELRNNLWINQGEYGPWKPKNPKATTCRNKHCNGIDDDKNGFVDDVSGWDFVNGVPVPFDTHGHGTHIAGIIASAHGNGFGIAGVCPNVSIMALKYYDNSVLGYNNLQNTVKAIEYAIANGAHIINYSGGGSDPAPVEAMAVKAAQKKGILFVAASGNDGRNNDWMPYYPASYPLDNIISVGSLNRQNKLLNSSNYGAKTVDMSAPGLGIISALPSGRFGTMSGTSQATAFVTGAAALLVSQLPSVVEFDYRKVKSWLERSAVHLRNKKTKKFMTGGVLSVPEALKLQSKELYGKPSAPAVAVKTKKSK